MLIHAREESTVRGRRYLANAAKCYHTHVHHLEVAVPHLRRVAFREDNDISNRNCAVYDFESNYLDLEIKTRHEAHSVVGHEKRGKALKHRSASVVK